MKNLHYEKEYYRMLTVMVHAKVKEEMLAEFVTLASALTKIVKENREGCISYSFNQSKTSPTEFVLYEQWENQYYLDLHISELCKQLGPPKPGYLLPEKLLNMYESAVPVEYKVIE